MLTPKLGSRCTAVVIGLASIGCQQAPEHALGPGLSWSRIFGGDGTARINDAVLDAEGDTVAVGSFSGALDMDHVTLTSNGALDVFVAKIGSDGRTIWARSFGSAELDRGDGVAVDREGNIWIVGDAAGAIDFGLGTLEGPALGSLFLAEYSPDGTPLSSRLFGDGGYNGANDVVVDDDGAVYVTGSFATSVDFGLGTMTSAGMSDIYLAKFDAHGTCVANRSFGDADTQYGIALAVTPQKEVVLLSGLGGTVDFGGGALIGSSGGASLAVAKFDERLNHIWSATALSSGASMLSGGSHQHAPVSAHSIAVQADDRTVVTGVGGIDFAMGSKDFEAPLLSSALLQEFGRYGDVLLDGPIASGDGQDEGAVAIEPGARSTIAGSFLGTLDFGSSSELVSEGGRDLYVAQFAADGTYLSGERLGDATHSEIAWTVAVNGGVVVVGGWVRPNDTFGVDRPLIASFRF